MSYSDYPVSNEPRTLRISLGSLLTIAALGYGLFVAVPQLQQALVMKPVAQKLSWAELVRDGLGDNAHIHLHSVDIPEPQDQITAIQKMIAEMDPQGDRAVMKQKVQESLAGVDAMQLLTQSASPIVVVPRGADPARVPATVGISRFDLQLARGRAEVASDSSITGYIRKSWDLRWVAKLMARLGTRGMSLDLENRPKYVVSPVHLVPNRNHSIGLAVACGLSAALGLVIAGSGGPSVLAFIFMPIPSLISMLGYPLRYGRGGFFARAFYLCVGFAALIGGFHLAWNLGGLTRVDGDTLLQSLGFVSCTLGIAAMLGAFLAARNAVPPIVQPKQIALHSAPELNLYITKVEKTKSILETSPRDQYTDPRLSDASEACLPRCMEDHCKVLRENGFGSPKQIYVHEDDRRNFTASMLGCQQIVLCETVENGTSSLTRFISVLTDGLVVITFSASTPKISQLRVGKNGVYLRAKTNSPLEILAEHLDRTVGIAEERRMQVVPLDEYERLDVFLLARRVHLDIQNDYNESKWTIPKATYGRFSFPGQSVELLVKPK